jgi:sterol desaturase/sphingolipid hydroxylase (fatty acid hydroxylase superfamily)
MRFLSPTPGLLSAVRHCALGPRLALGALLAYFIAPCLHTLHHRNDHSPCPD